MRKVGYMVCLLLLPVCLALATGCGGGTKKSGGDGGDGGDNGNGGSAKKSGKAGMIAVKSWGSLKGMVTYDGDPPGLSEEKEIDKHTDKEKCHTGAVKIELSQQEWIVDPKTKGVANVVVFIKPTERKQWFEVPKEDQKRTNKVVLDQPHCAYLPHVVAIYSEYKDKDGKMKKTGQEFIIKNSAKTLHNTQFEGDALKGNASFDQSLPIGKEKAVNSADSVNLHPQKDPIIFSCKVHKWMRAYGWVFDNPFFAVSEGSPTVDQAGKVTLAEPEAYGKYDIARVPAGIPVRVVVWHEGNYLNSDGFEGANGKEMTFMEGANELNIKLAK